MGLYARRPGRLAAQLAADLFVLAWALAWWFVGRFAAATVRLVAEPAKRTASTASGLVDEFRQAAAEAGRVPGVGSDLRRPFDAAADSLKSVVGSADAQVASLERLATVVGWLVFLIPVTVLVAVWLPRRIRFLLRARAAQRFLDSAADLDLFALRAMATSPMHVLARISDDPVAAWRSGDRTVIARLAELEIRRSGLRMPRLGAAQPDPAGRPERPRSGWDR